ncbi:hypothetical protein ACHQM5_003901 [Ranunculus cassubicifolius]
MGLSSSTLSKNTAEESGSKTLKLHQPLSSKVDELVSGVSRVTSSMFKENMFFTHKIEDKEALRLKMLMPGITKKEDVIVAVERGKLTMLGIEGGSHATDEDDDDDGKK